MKNKDVATSSADMAYSFMYAYAEIVLLSSAVYILGAIAVFFIKAYFPKGDKPLHVSDSSIQDLKGSIEREIQRVPEDGVTDEDGNWSSHEQEVKRLENLLRDISYYMRDYS